MKACAFIVLVWAVTSCGDATSPSAAIIGSWATPIEDIGSGFSRSQSVAFRSDGTMHDVIRVYKSGRLDATYESWYAYEVRSDSLFTRYPAGSVNDLLGYMARFNRGRIDLDGARLTITYPWFGPADEPITVTTMFFRDACLMVAWNRCM